LDLHCNESSDENRECVNAFFLPYLIAEDERCAALPAIWGRIQSNFCQFFLYPVNKTLFKSVHTIKS
jgi:hypothetical protein